MDDYAKKIGIPDNHKLIQTDTTWRQGKGLDTDTYWLDEQDENGKVVATYIVKDSTSMYPPFGRSINFEKIS